MIKLYFTLKKTIQILKVKLKLKEDIITIVLIKVKIDPLRFSNKI